MSGTELQPVRDVTPHPPSEDVVIDLKNFSIFPPSRNVPIVYRFSLQVKRGTLVALMGGSGCGKTTLIVYLTRRMRNPYTDWGVTADAYVHPTRVEFVAQKELFFPYDTAERHLLFLRQRYVVEPMQQSRDVVHRTLRLVGLTDETKWTVQIGEAGRESTLSGGERRLLTVAAALVTDPEVVVLDEPTSGMDGYTAMNIVQHLRHIAEHSGTTFIVSIHQPSDKLLAVFDAVERMTPPAGDFERAPAIDGRDDVHAKRRKQPRAHSSNALPEDHLPVEPAETDVLSTATASGFVLLPHFLKLFLWRAFLRCWTNWRAGPLRLVASLVFAIMCGVAWVDLDFNDGNFIRDVLGMALALIGLSFAPIILNATLFATERDMIMEENVDLSHLSLACDSIARWASDIVLSAGAAAVLMVAIPIIGIKYVGWFFLTMWLQAWAADSFGYWISMVAAPHIAIGVVIPTVGFLSIAIGTGLMQPEIKDEGYIFHVAKWVSFFKYGFQALLIQELPRATIPCTQTCVVSTGDQMLDMMHLSGDGYEVTMGFQYLMLFAITVVLRIISFFTLRGLILVGNRRYSYDNSSAGSAPVPVADAHATAVVAVADDDQLTTSQNKEPHEDGIYSAEQPIAADAVLQQEQGNTRPDSADIEILDVPPRGFDGSATKERSWSMAPVHLEVGIASKLMSCCRSKDDVVECKYQKKVLLDVPSFAIHPQETVALIGPTGSGKTLLLRHMSSRLGDGVSTDAPTRFYSSCKVCREPTIQFVDGNDSILPNLQAVEPVAFHASLYDPEIDEKEVEGRSAEQLLALGIHKEKHHNMAYTLSGGQLRRLSVACKTVMQPAVLLIDEPTSGLDHDAAVNLGRHLQTMAKESGVAVVCSLQQPDPTLLSCFDTFVFMREGRIVVKGNERECRTHLQIAEDSPSWAEDALLALARSCESDVCPEQQRRIPDCPPQQHAAFDESDRVAIFHDPRRSLFFCVKELTKRSFLNRWARAPRQTLVAFLIRYLLLPVALSVLLVNVGSKDPMYFNRSGLLFVYCACVSFSSMLNGAVTFPTARSMVEEEINANLYTTTAYLFSQWFTTALVEDAIGCVLGSIALKYIASLEVHLGLLMITTFTISQCCDSIGYLCGLLRDLPVASGVTVLVLMPFMIGGNVIATSEQVTRIPLLHVLEGLSSVRYSYLILFYNELQEGTGSVAMADAIFKGFGLHPDSKWYQAETLWPVFVCYAVALRIVVLLLYKRLICPSCAAGQ